VKGTPDVDQYSKRQGITNTINTELRRQKVGNITGQNWAEAQAYQVQNKEQYRRRTGILAGIFLFSLVC
jgi:hypothetical protein